MNFKCYTYTENGVQKVAAVTKYNGHNYRAVASCNPADTYSEEVGRKLAIQRARVKAYRAETREAKADMEYFCGVYGRYLADWVKVSQLLQGAEEKLGVMEEELQIPATDADK